HDALRQCAGALVLLLHDLHAQTRMDFTADRHTHSFSVSFLYGVQSNQDGVAGAGLQVPITVVLDNARYQRCELVQSVARQLGIRLLLLPSYSPIRATRATVSRGSVNLHSF